MTTKSSKKNVSSLRKVRTAVLVSGYGSNLQALIDAAKEKNFPAEISVVISNNEEAHALTRAESAGITNITIPHQNFPSREAFDAMIHEALLSHEIELVCLAGFMRILSDGFVKQWQGRMMNIHPSLLPKFKGTNTHQRALDAGETEHGCTVHWVIPELDAGPTILQSSLKINKGETAASLKERVHALEHTLYPEALKKAAQSLV